MRSSNTRYRIRPAAALPALAPGGGSCRQRGCVSRLLSLTRYGRAPCDRENLCARQKQSARGARASLTYDDGLGQLTFMQVDNAGEQNLAWIALTLRNQYTLRTSYEMVPERESLP
jgi:hypothetical protein